MLVRLIRKFPSKQVACFSVFLILAISTLCTSILSHITLICSLKVYRLLTLVRCSSSDWRILRLISYIRCIQIFVDHSLKKTNQCSQCCQLLVSWNSVTNQTMNIGVSSSQVVSPQTSIYLTSHQIPLGYLRNPGQRFIVSAASMDSRISIKISMISLNCNISKRCLITTILRKCHCPASQMQSLMNSISS